jgi:DNA-binding CsgD family transcriptional regulator
VGGLLERDREIAEIGVALTQARAGVGQCIIVEGPAGIGKTALLDLVKTMADDGGFRVLGASGGELEIDLPFGVVRQLFGPLVIDKADWRSLFAGPASMARPVLSLTGSTEPLQSSGGRGLLESLHGLFWLTSNLAESIPLLLAIDDAHWCDGASLRYLIYVQRRLEGLPLAMVVAHRPGEPSGHPGLLDHLGIQGRAMVLHPSRLSEPAVGALLHAALSEVPDPDFTAAAHTATGGNPFLVHELAIALIDKELRPTSHTAAQLSMIGPDAVKRSILRRLSALGPGATALAQAAAVLGNGCELRHAARLSGLDTGRATELVDSLVRVQILRDEPQLGFVHPLVRAAVYADMTAASRARAHAEAAVILSSEGADVDAVAAHLLESPALGNADVVDILRGAARRAAGHGAMDVASSYLRRALTEPPRGHQYADVLRELGTAELAAGQPNAAAERLAAAAAEANDFDSRLSIVLMRRHALVLADRIAEAVSVVDAVGASPDGRGYADLLEAAAIGAGQLDFAVAPTLEHRLIALRDRAKKLAITEPLAFAVAASANALANGDLELTQALTERAVDSLTAAHPQSDYTVEGQIAVALYLAERYDRLAELSSRWLDDARRRGSLPRFISMATLRAHAAYRVGALADAESDAHDALEAARFYGHQFWLPGAVAALLNPLVEHGRFDEAERLLAETRVQENHGKSSAFCWAAMFLPARGRLRLAQGRLQQGLADLLACGDRYESNTNRSPSLWAWRSESALALDALGEHGRAVELATTELALARKLGAQRALGVAHRVTGLLIGGDAGLAELAEAVAVLSTSSARLEHARALADLGGALRRTGQRTEARARLREAEDLALRCGAELLARRAHDELVASGAHPRRARLSGPDSLTPGELRVARLAAEGRSNPEIAHQLFLTRRTVETHLTHAYQKLEIGSREDLANALRGA